MTTIALVGAGAVGARTARQLLDTPGLSRLLIVDRSRANATELAASVGGEAVALNAATIAVADAVALAVPGRAAAQLAERIISSGVPVAAATDDGLGIDALFALDILARENATQIIVGCALLPGLGDILARHAANALERADEVQVARVGTAGPTCAASLRRARREPAREWINDSWQIKKRAGTQLVWFPEPIGAQECEVVSLGAENIHRAVPEATFVSVRAGEAPTRRPPLPPRVSGHPREIWAGLRVEVSGWQGNARSSIVYGMVERPAPAAGAVLAIAAARLAGLVPEVQLVSTSPGAYSLGGVVNPVSFLSELATRGLRVASFEGVVGSAGRGKS